MSETPTSQSGSSTGNWPRGRYADSCIRSRASTWATVEDSVISVSGPSVAAQPTGTIRASSGRLCGCTTRCVTQRVVGSTTTSASSPNSASVHRTGRPRSRRRDGMDASKPPRPARASSQPGDARCRPRAGGWPSRRAATRQVGYSTSPVPFIAPARSSLVLQGDCGMTQSPGGKSTRSIRDQGRLSSRTSRASQSLHPEHSRRGGARRARCAGHPLLGPVGGRPKGKGVPTVEPTSTATPMARSHERRNEPAAGPPRGRRSGSARRRARATGLLVGVTTAVGLMAPGLAGAATAPANIISFPARDFVSATGFKLTDLYTVEVQHPNGTVSGTVTGLAPKDDGEGGGLGIIEVNHPGGYCWNGVTPDIRAGDIVRFKDETTGTVDESTVRNVTDSRPVQTGPGTIQIHGTAQDSAGLPLPVGELEQRLVVASADPFAVNGRRTLRATSAAGSDGTLKYDGAGSTAWTATYSGLAQADIDRALGAESRGMWIDPALPSTESTIFENGAAATAGPTSPCAAPLEKLPPPPGSETTPPSDVFNLTGSAANSTVTLNWDAASDNVGVTDYGIYRDGVAIANVQNPDGTPNPTTTFTDQNVAAGQHTYTVDAGDAVGNRSVNMSNTVTVTTSVNPAVPATAPTPTGLHSLIGFPQRDFISATGYTPGVAYTFSVIRGGNVVSTSSPVTADATGLAEVNHPGGGCWTGVTPNIQPGDSIRISGGGIIEQTTVAGVANERPIVTSIDPVTGGGTIEVHGTARDAAGAPLPIDQIEQRLVARNDSFDINGRRTIRAANAAGEDGTLTYDAPGSIRWTAKYTLQTPDDLARAVGGKSTSGTSFDGSESRVLWLGSAPAAGNELTIYENGAAIAGGPGAGIAGCTSGPAEIPAPNVTLSAAPKFATTDVGSTSATQDVTITNSGTAPLNFDRAYLAGLNPGDFVLTVPAGANGSIVDPGKSVTVKVAFKPTIAGTRQANLSFGDDAANSTDQTLTLTGTTPAAPGPVSTAPVQSLAAVFNDPIQLFSPLGNSKLPVDFRWTNGGGTSELQIAAGAPTAGVGAGAGGGQPVPRAAPTATSTRLFLQMGTTTGTAYQFRVRGCSAGVCGGWATGPKFTLVPADDGNMAPGLFKGTWTTTALAGSYGGTVKRASGSAQATLVPAVQYTVSGNAAWVSTLGPDQGLAQVQVDNGKPEVVDLYSPTVQPRRVVWARDAMAAGTHTVTVTVLGKKSTLNPNPCNTGTKCAQVDVDASIMIK